MGTFDLEKGVMLQYNADLLRYEVNSHMEPLIDP